jgi:arabinose-5-phosphate isomerase
VEDLPLLSEVRRTLRLEGEAILAAEAALSDAHSPAAQGWIKALGLMRKSLEQGGKIVVTGVGKSGKIANKIAASLSSTGSQATFLHPTEGLHGDLGFVTSKDVILALSYTGNTEELLRILPAFQALKTPIISITGKAISRLAEQSDAVIDASVAAEAYDEQHACARHRRRICRRSDESPELQRGRLRTQPSRRKPRKTASSRCQSLHAQRPGHRHRH